MRCVVICSSPRGWLLQVPSVMMFIDTKIKAFISSHYINLVVNHGRIEKEDEREKKRNLDQY